MLNVLFVDDETNVLDGLQRMLRPMRHEWKLNTAVGGRAALDFMEQQKIDVVVSDMKMPGMDGAQLLEMVREKYPQTIRIILSGFSEKEMVMKTVGTAHQYLSKPCDSEILKETIQRAFALRTLLADEKIRNIVSKLQTIPSLPTLYADVCEELKKKEPSIHNIAKIVSCDIGMTAKILQIVNSAFFGLRRDVSDVTEAIGYLGLETVSALTLVIGIFSKFECNSEQNQMLSKLWQHSVDVSALSKAITAREVPGDINLAFSAGLLHDIGEVVLAFNMPNEFKRVRELVFNEGKTFNDAELEVYDTTHAEIGAYLLGLWGLPTKVVEAVAFHHKPNMVLTDQIMPLAAVHVANVFSRYKQIDVLADVEKYFDTEFLTRTKQISKLSEWKEMYDSRCE